MPSRWLCLVIVASWVATTGWLVWHDLWPDWHPGEPPPFHIDLVEEVTPRGNTRPTPTRWTVQRQRREDKAPVKLFSAETWTSLEPDKDEFTLHADFTNRRFENLSPYVVGNMFKVEAMNSEYRVDRSGRLRSLRATLSLSLLDPEDRGGKKKPEKSVAGGPPLQGSSQVLRVVLWGEVRDGRFFGHCEGGIGAEARDLRVDLPPADLSYNGSLLMPLHPVNRIHGLRPGQAWRQPLIDPFRDALSPPGFAHGVRYLNARVLPEPQVLEWDRGARADCLVVEYESEGETVGRTWVEKDSELVQQQEAYLDDDHWIMQREARKTSARPRSDVPGEPPASRRPRNEP